MKKIHIAYLILCITFIGIHITIKAESKKDKINKQFELTQELINSKQFRVDLDYAYPSGGQSISLFSNRGTIKVINDTAIGSLPFFGRGYSLPYGGGGGITFDNKILNPDIQTNAKKKNITYKFEVNGENDNYQISILFTASGNCTVYVNSNNRSAISYSGKLLPIEEKAKN